MFPRRFQMLWRYWSVLNPHLLLIVTCSGKTAAVEKSRAVVDRVILSLELPVRDILLGRNFTETVVSIARSWFPQTSVAIVDDAHLQFGNQNVSLLNLHRRYLASPEDLPMQVRTYFAAVQEQLPVAIASPWSHARDRIFPILLTTNAVNNAPGRIHYEPWINHLSIAYVLEDFSNRSSHASSDTAAVAERGICREDLVRWKISPEALHEQALHNLILSSHEYTMQGQKGSGFTMLGLGASESEDFVAAEMQARRNNGGGEGTPGAGDRHNAARILLPELHRKLREHLGNTFYAAIPSRYFLLAFSASSDDVMSRVRGQVAQEYARAPANAALSSKLFLVTPDGIAGDPQDEEDFIL
jgi:hypothetical protein